MSTLPFHTITRRLLPVIVLLAAAAGARWLFHNPPQAPHADMTRPAPIARYIESRAQTLPIPITSQGRLEPKTRINLLATVPGTVIHVSENLVTGGSFRQGERLMGIDPAPMELELHKARAALEQASAAERQAQARLEAERVIAAGNNPGSLTQAESQLAMASANRAAAEAAVKMAGRQLSQATLNAPFDGKVLQAGVQLHEQLVPGKPLAQIYATGTFMVRLAITQEQLSLLDHSHWASHAVYLFDSTRQGHYNGRLVRSEGQVSPTGMVYLVAEVDDSPAGTLMPGTLVQATIDSSPQPDIRVIPEQALRSNNTLWLAGDDNRLSIIPVTPVALANRQAYIRLSPEDSTGPVLRIITGAIHHPAEGMPVRPEPVSGPSG